MRLREIIKAVNDGPQSLEHRRVKKLCGELLGSGAYRDVYAMKDNKNYVIKIERDMTVAIFANVTECRNWMNHKESVQLGPWLAPVELINETGNVIIQRRVSFRGKEHYPDKIPNVLRDRKYDNYGWIGERFVCCDYSFIATSSFRLSRVVWIG